MYIAPPHAAEIESALSFGDFSQVHTSRSLLARHGVLVPATANELRRAELIHDASFQRRDHLHLILLPTGQCNFRCTYCYERFRKGPMSSDICDGIRNLVIARSLALSHLDVMWFGGEPLLATDIIASLSRDLLEICRSRGIKYSATLTTNGYLLNEGRVALCLNSQIRNFQVTLDGPPEVHDRQRVLALKKGATSDQILRNLERFRLLSFPFHVRIRVNFTESTAATIPAFVRFLGEKFAQDDRFSINFHNIGRYGGPNDHSIEPCDKCAADEYEYYFMQCASLAGFDLTAWREPMQRVQGFSCYAADPHSLVIDSDGAVFKCTVAFDDPRNRIGTLYRNRLDIDSAKLALWTRNGVEHDSECQRCGFRSACEGNMCPLERLRSRTHVCPSVTRDIHRRLILLSESMMRARKACFSGDK